MWKRLQNTVVEREILRRRRRSSSSRSSFQRYESCSISFWPDIFLMLPEQSDISIGKSDIFKHNRTQNVLTYDHHLCCLQWLKKIISSIIFYYFRRGLSRQECIAEFKSLFGDKAPFYSTVKNWFNEFNCGRRSLKDEVREGPPKTAVVSENIDAVRTVNW